MNLPFYDTIIIGGSYSGLSAAMALGRSLRNVLVIDNKKPCNASTPHSHNFITHDGAPPATIAAEAAKELTTYKTVTLREDTVASVSGSNNSFIVSTTSGGTVGAKKLLFATGIRDIMPEIEGFAECWGISVLHCPYCHGFEVRDRKTAILANGAAAFELGKLISNWTSDLVIVTNGVSAIAEENLRIMMKRGLKVIEKEITRLEHETGNVKGIAFADGSVLEVSAIYARPTFVQHSLLPEKLGCAMQETGHIMVDDLQRTTVKGIYAAGDCCSPFRSVANAVAAGSKAGAAINRELIDESFR